VNNPDKKPLTQAPQTKPLAINAKGGPKENKGKSIKSLYRGIHISAKGESACIGG